MPTPGAPGTGETDGAGDHFGQWSLRGLNRFSLRHHDDLVSDLSDARRPGRC